MATIPQTRKEALAGFGIDEATHTRLMETVSQSLGISSGRGSTNSVMQTILSRHDRFGTSLLQINAESVGLTFFTKPCLNMTTESLRQDPTMAMLDTLDPNSWMFALRCNLDTVFAKSSLARPYAKVCPWFNDQTAFNVPIGNMLVGMSGWPDFNLETKTTESGIFSEDMTLARGSDWGRRTYDLSCTFRDIQGGYLMAYFYYWIVAMVLQMEGTMVAYPADRAANRLNYTCSIYRFVMDPSMRTITKWAKATGCYPTSIPIGDVFNFGPGDSFVHTSQQFTIPFRANHVRYMDPRQLSQFNTLVKRYAGENVATGQGRKKTEISARHNFSGVPWIDLTSGTNELMYLALPEELVDTTLTDAEKIIQSVRKSTTTSSTTPV